MLKIEATKKSGFKNIEECLWRDVRSSVQKCCPELAAIIDQINPSDGLSFIKVSYSFGDPIVQNGKLHLLELAKHTKSFTEQESKTILKHLNYATSPLGIVLNKGSEVFLDIHNRIIPCSLLLPGHSIGLIELMNKFTPGESHPHWSITAGARSIFMLPKVNNSIGYNKLEKEFKINTPIPKTLTDQWHLFTEILSAPNMQTEWEQEVLFFTNDWITRFNNNTSSWIKLREHFYRENWLKYGALTDVSMALIWQQFASFTTRRRFKPRIYVTDTIRHLFRIACGHIPGFAPTSESEQLCPTAIIKKAFVDVYGLKNHAPTMLAPSLINNTNSTVYYSIGNPSLFEGHPEVFSVRNTVEYLREIQKLIQNMYDYRTRGLSGVNKLEKFIDSIEFTYFHKIPDVYSSIMNTELIPQQDTRFSEYSVPNQSHDICTTGPFLNGCVRISRV